MNPAPANRAIICPCCRKLKQRKGNYPWCTACYQRWIRAGRPPGGPARPLTRETCAERARAAYQEQARGRREDYQELRSWGETREVAAARVGVTERTVQRYERALREQVSA